MNGFFAGVGAGLIFVFIVGLIFIGPFLTIWMLNTLFGLGIVLGWKTWLAAAFLNMLLSNFWSSATKKNES